MIFCHNTQIYKIPRFGKNPSCDWSQLTWPPCLVCWRPGGETEEAVEVVVRKGAHGIKEADLLWEAVEVVVRRGAGGIEETV